MSGTARAIAEFPDRGAPRLEAVAAAPPAGPPEPLVQFAKRIGIIATAIVVTGGLLQQVWLWTQRQVNAPVVRQIEQLSTRIESTENHLQAIAVRESVSILELRALRGDVIRLAVSIGRSDHSPNAVPLPTPEGFPR